MTFKRTQAAVFLAASLFSGSATASDSQGLYQTLYFVPCPTYAEHRKEPAGTGNNALDQVYVVGWLSGYNYLTPNTYDILPGHNVAGVMQWLDVFCAKNPTKSIDSGLLQLTSELYPGRVKEFVAQGQPAPQAPADATGTASQRGKAESKFSLPKTAEEEPKAKTDKAKPAAKKTATGTATKP